MDQEWLLWLVLWFIAIMAGIYICAGIVVVISHSRRKEKP